MKLIFHKKILIFITCFMMIFNHFKSTEVNNFDLASQDLISFLMTESEYKNAQALPVTKPCAEPPLFNGTTRGLPNLSAQEIDIPVTFGSLLQGYTFIFGVDDPSKEYKVMDQYDSYEVALLVYRNVNKADKIGRVALDLREFGWKCGPKKVCELGNFYANLNAKEFDVNAFKSQVETFFTKINGISKVCIGDTYIDLDESTKAVVFCFNSQNDLTKFEALFHYVSEKDLNKSTQAFDPETELSFDIEFSDGHSILIKKFINFKIDGMYENNKLLMKYDVIEVFDSKKCNIIQSLPIVPIKFLDVKIYNSKCVAKFKYNRVDTYIGSTNTNCANIITYVTTKMRNSCNISKNGPMNKYKDELINRSFEGVWTGWVRYHKIIESGGIIDPAPYKVVINPDATQVFNNMSALIQTIGNENVIWSCNNDGDCSIKDFILYLSRSKQNSKLSDFTNVIMQITDKWLFQDYNHCFVIEEKETHLICTIDYSEEYDIRKALSIAVDKRLIDAPATSFIPNANGISYKVLYSTDSSLYFDDYDITILPEGIKDSMGAIIIEYAKIQPLKSIECGFEFRHISLPNQYHEINARCCARFFTDENNIICIQQQSKCYIELRRMIQLIRTNCQLSKGVAAPAATIPNLPGTDITKKPEPVPKIPVTNWSGDVFFSEIDNFKHKGELNSQKGNLNLDVKAATYSVNGVILFSFPLESLNFLCESATPCIVADYITNQTPYLEKEYDEPWQQQSLSKFWEANKDINQKDCMVLISEDTYLELSTMILTCNTAPGQGEAMRQAVADVYGQKIAALKGNEKDIDNIPSSNDNREFTTLIVAMSNSTSINKAQAVISNIKIGLDGILYKESGDFVFRYQDVIQIEKGNVLLQFSLELKEIPSDLIIKKANPKCCFKTFTNSGKVYFICLTGEKCYFDKAIFYRTIQTRSVRAMKILAAELRRDANLKDAKVEDPFDYGLGPDFKKFSPKFNLDKLNADTFDNSKNGVWQGWVYETAMTERNFNKKVSPVWMEIGNGLIIFKIDEEEPMPYKKLKLVEYNQACPTHCMPKEYILNKLKTVSDYDDMMYLSKAVMNVLGQLKNPYVEEGCVLLDFTSPIYQFGHSIIICGVDKLHGNKIRAAIDNSYYQALLDLDINKQVRRPRFKSDLYSSRIIINDKISEDFNQIYIDKYGIVGRKMSSDPKNNKPLTPDIYNMTYSKMADDNFGTPCAFWYKDLKIKQRSADMLSKIPDNNCCFKFYTKGDKQKIEICTYSLDGGICIKNARELMKGMKLGCLRDRKFEIRAAPAAEQELDIYKYKTIDDSENGIFEGFVYFGSVLSSSQTLRANPYYIRVHKMSIELYEDHTKTESPTISLNIETLKFSCPERSACSPDNYLAYAQSNTKLMSSSSTIETVYNLFRDTYGINDRLNKNCFVLETNETPYLACPYIPETLPIIQKALIQAYILNNSCRKLSSIPDSDPKDSYHIIISENTAQVEDDVVVTTSGVISLKTKNLVLDYKALDSDPVNKKRCAIWFKEIPIKFNYEHPECCFMVSTSGKLTTMCVKDEKICVGSSFRLMKAIWNGCMYSTPSQNVMQPSADSEILGETQWKPKIVFDSNKEKYDICPSKRNLAIFNSNEVLNDYNVDLYNEVAYSYNKTLYKGWFNVYPIDVQTESNWSLLNYYGELSSEAFKFYQSPTEKMTTKLVIRPDSLAMTCGKGSACKPKKFIDYLATFNTTLGFLKNTIKAKLDLFEIKKEEGCAVLENMVANIPNYFIVCVHIRKTRSLNPILQDLIEKQASYSENRDLISQFYGDIIRKIIYDAYVISRKFTNIENLSEGNNEPIKQAKMTHFMATNEFTRVTISDVGVVANSVVIYKFEEMAYCRVRHNLIYAPESVVYDKKPNCCIRFNGNKNHEYICIRELNCEYSINKFAKSFNDKCKISKKNTVDDVFNELNAGNNVFAMNLIKQVFKSEIKYTDIKVLNPSQTLSTDEFRIKHKTLAIKFIYKIKELMHSVTLVEITSSKNMVTTPNDTSPVDGPSQIITEKVEPRYIGESDEYKITAGVNRVTEYRHKTNGDVVTIIKGIQFIQTNEFQAIIADKSEYMIIIYKDDGDKILEIKKDGVLLTNTAHNLSANYKVKTGGIIVPEALEEKAKCKTSDPTSTPVQGLADPTSTPLQGLAKKK